MVTRMHVYFEGCNAASVAVRVVFTAIYTVGMEYVARYNHLYLWHSKELWWLHCTHHHQVRRDWAGARRRSVHLR